MEVIKPLVFLEHIKQITIKIIEKTIPIVEKKDQRGPLGELSSAPASPLSDPYNQAMVKILTQEGRIEALNSQYTKLQGLTLEGKTFNNLEDLFTLYKPIIESLCLVILCLGCDQIFKYHKVLKQIQFSVIFYLEITNDLFASYVKLKDEKEVLNTLSGKTPHLLTLTGLTQLYMGKKLSIAKKALTNILNPSHMVKAEGVGTAAATVAGLVISPLAAIIAGFLGEFIMHGKRVVETKGEMGKAVSALVKHESQLGEPDPVGGQDQQNIQKFLEYNIKCRLVALIYVILSYFSDNHYFNYRTLKKQTMEDVRFITDIKFCLHDPDKSFDTDVPEGDTKPQRKYIVKLKELYGIKGGFTTKKNSRNRKRSFKKRYQTHNRRLSKKYNVRKKLKTTKTKNMKKLNNRKRNTKVIKRINHSV
jgi:hypothetical protein